MPVFPSLRPMPVFPSAGNWLHHCFLVRGSQKLIVQPSKQKRQWENKTMQPRSLITHVSLISGQPMSKLLIIGIAMSSQQCRARLCQFRLYRSCPYEKPKLPTALHIGNRSIQASVSRRIDSAKVQVILGNQSGLHKINEGTPYGRGFDGFMLVFTVWQTHDGDVAYLRLEGTTET